MKIEIRNGSQLHITGYVNAVERDSKVLPREMAFDAASDFVEQVGAGVFKRAISRNPNVKLFFNHCREIGSVSGGELELREDNIGLYADARISDIETVEAARRGELRGWSFGFSGAKSRWETISEKLCRRYLTEFDLFEVSILTKEPAYVGTSVEVRGEAAEVREFRCFEDEASLEEIPREERGGETTENTSDHGRFFITQKRLELLGLETAWK